MKLPNQNLNVAVSLLGYAPEVELKGGPLEAVGSPGIVETSKERSSMLHQSNNYDVIYIMMSSTK